jgi:hypothetical protein
MNEAEHVAVQVPKGPRHSSNHITNSSRSTTCSPSPKSGCLHSGNEAARPASHAASESASATAAFPAKPVFATIMTASTTPASAALQAYYSCLSLANLTA